jgi:chromosome segregation ATPase
MPFTRQKERHGNNDLENEIRELTRHYNEYYRQITELKAEQDKRIEVEKRLRANEKTVYDYCTCKVNMDECLKSYQEKSRMIEDKQQELSKTANRQEDRTSQLKFKAEIQDLDVHRNDLRAKIEFYRKQLSDLEKEEIVQNYKALLSQMEKIRNVLREKREQAEAIKVQVQAKTKELEALRG